MENNLSETAFTVPDASGDADYELRWFTPTTEVALCGHATLASGHVLIEGERGPLPHPQGGRAGGAARRRRADARPAGDAGAPQRAPGLLDALGTPEAEVFQSPTQRRRGDRDRPPRGRGGGARLRARHARARGIELMAIVTAPGDGDRTWSAASSCPPGAWTRTRSPAPPMPRWRPFWAERLGRDSFTAFQASRAAAIVDCRLAGDRAILGGRCVTVIDVGRGAPSRTRSPSLDLGADDFVRQALPAGRTAWPRIRAVLRRRGPSMATAANDITVEEDGGSTPPSPDGEVRFARLEGKLFNLLESRGDDVVTYDDIIEAIWGKDKPRGQSHVRVLVGQLRRKLEMQNSPHKIRSERGAGYRLWKA
jgi:hypothetical protein